MKPVTVDPNFNILVYSDTSCRIGNNHEHIGLKWPDATVTTERLTWKHEFLHPAARELVWVPYITIKVHGAPLETNLPQLLRKTDRMRLWSIKECAETG